MRSRPTLCLSSLLIVIAGCAQTPPADVRVVSVPSSAPYRYITFSKKDDPDTIRQIKRHNRAHQAVISAEKKAAAK